MKIISAADQQEDPDRADGLITTLRVATDTLHWNLLTDSTRASGWAVCGYPQEGIAPGFRQTADPTRIKRVPAGASSARLKMLVDSIRAKHVS
jgi:hypothetical protein